MHVRGVLEGFRKTRNNVACYLLLLGNNGIVSIEFFKPGGELDFMESIILVVRELFYTSKASVVLFCTSCERSKNFDTALSKTGATEIARERCL